MVFGWRRAFCTSLPRESHSDSAIKLTRDEFDHDSDPSYPTLRCRTTTAATATLPAESASVPVSPTLNCKARNKPGLFQSSSTPSSPRSHSTFSILKSTLRFSTNRCGLCLQSVKRGRGVAIFTAECCHSFHFPCIAGYVKKKGSLACPVCSTVWNEMPLLCVNDLNQKHEKSLIDEAVEKRCKLKKQNSLELKVYNDDEPLARFNPIPESDESCDEDSIGEFQGFHINGSGSSPVDVNARDVDVRLLPEAVVISSSRSYDTYAIVLRAKAPPIPAKKQRRAPIDLVTVVDVSAKMSNENHIVEAMAVVDGSPNATDAVKKAVKVLEDRREKNAVASIILLTDVPSQSSYVSSTRYLNVAVHTFKIKLTAIDDHALTKIVGSLISVTVQDLQLQLGFVSGSAPAEITAVYSYAPRLSALGTSTVQIGELYASEEREMLIELKVPLSAVRAYQVLSVRCSYRESGTQDIIYCNEHALVVPRPHTVRSSTLTIQRLRNLFITTRALAESRRLSAKNDLIGAYAMLISARETLTLHQPSLDSREFVASLEAELHDLHRRRQAQADENGEALTPTSAWRVADKLAKVAVMRKSLNRVGDLHGFEDARF